MTSVKDRDWPVLIHHTSFALSPCNSSPFLYYTPPTTFLGFPMAYDSLLRRSYFIFFGVIVVIAVIELAISAWLTARYASRHNFLSTTERDRVHFLLFCSVWSTVLSPIFPVLLTQELALFVTGIAAHTIFVFISWVFWLSGAAAITASLGGGLDCNFHFVFLRSAECSRGVCVARMGCFDGWTHLCFGDGCTGQTTRGRI